ncbi:hypothetical protein [Desnuesiella massiliensis]|uniref:hypothetical protein n=1 Tax=Desnuesiella massiliensis TaxID=1650662 RepID=UPI0006E44D62|nr:hypothetical protein [Desnuesiella massiliensis]
MSKKDEYYKIIDFLCEYNNISEEKLYTLLKKQELRYLLFLLLKKHKCTDKNILVNLFGNDSERVNLNFRKAEEKFLVNRDFREKYFEIEEEIKKII